MACLKVKKHFCSVLLEYRVKSMKRIGAVPYVSDETRKDYLKEVERITKESIKGVNQ